LAGDFISRQAALFRNFQARNIPASAPTVISSALNIDRFCARMLGSTNSFSG
jgi:hypothetical protein